MKDHFDYPYIKGEEKSTTNKYKCKYCGKEVERESEKQWIPSYCEETGKTVRLIRLS
jgi:ribosomal protein L37AE/L43A